MKEKVPGRKNCQTGGYSFYKHKITDGSLTMWELLVQDTNKLYIYTEFYNIQLQSLILAGQILKISLKSLLKRYDY